MTHTNLSRLSIVVFFSNFVNVFAEVLFFFNNFVDVFAD